MKVWTAATLQVDRRPQMTTNAGQQRSAVARPRSFYDFTILCSPFSILNSRYDKHH
jgi:hypothetical protein